MTGIVSNYAKRMAQLSSRIFGEVVRTTPSHSLMVVKIFSCKPLDKTPAFYDYYPKHIELTSLMRRLRFLGLYRDEHRDFKEEVKRLKALRGIVKPKKGEGKRASKKKSK